MPNDFIRSYENAAEMTDFWLKKIVPRYFNPDSLNTYRAGTLGYITDILSTTTEDTFHAMMIAKREVLPNTAQYLSSLYLHAAARLMDAPMANPAVATVMLMIQQSDILKFGTQEGDLHTFILDDTFIADVGGLKFMLDYPITILSMKRENGKYACLPIGQAGSRLVVRCVQLISFAHAHNEKPCPITIDKILRYEGVQIVSRTNHRRIHLTLLPFRVMYKMARTHERKNNC